MAIHKVEQQYNPGALLVNGAIFGIILFFIVAVINPYVLFTPLFTVVPILIVMIVISVRQVRINRWLSDRSETLALIDAQPVKTREKLDRNFNFFVSSVTDKDNVRNKRFSNYVHGEDWIYADFSYDHYTESRSGDYRSRTVYYAVMTTKLGRQLPHVFFDSYKARRRQFRFIFSSAQIQSLEGNFDKHFVTYFPSEYHIDGRSLITPEVMEALIEADDYDIEIIGDQLFLIGSLKEPESQLLEMESKIRKIKQTIQNNSFTYRDENLPYQLGRQHVAPLGARLAVNLTGAYITAAAGALFLILFLYVFTVLQSSFFYIFIIGLAFLLQGLRQIVTEQKRRKRVQQVSKPVTRISV